MRYCLLLLSLWAGLSHGGDYDDAMGAFQAQEYARALTLLIPLAEQSNANAQHRIAVIYRHGLGVKKDSQQAIE